jgi:hypothetical protein
VNKLRNFIESKTWLAKRIPDFGGTIRVQTGLAANLKVLPDLNRDEVERLVANGGYAGIRELLLDRPNLEGLWLPTKVGRLVKNRKVTDVFVNDIVDTLESSVAAFSAFKYHHSGTGIAAENQTDTALGTPRESARDVGTQVDGASSNIYKSVATTTYTNTWAITEHGLFNTAGAGGPPVTGGDLMDRTVFSAINVVATNQIEWTFTITFTAGG